MSNVKEIGPQGMTMEVMLEKVLAECARQGITHGIFLGILPTGGILVMNTAMTLAQCAYVCKMHEIATENQLLGRTTKC